MPPPQNGQSWTCTSWRSEVQVGTQQEAVVHSWIECFAAQNLDGIVDLYSDDAAYYVGAWHQPIVGRDAIRAEIAQQFTRVSDDDITILNIFSTDSVVFFEAVDNFMYGHDDVTLHWASVWEINPLAEIAAQRDYSDPKELESRLR